MANTHLSDFSTINLDTRILRYIVDIVNEKSLTKAAEKNYLSQPALSRYLHNLENEIGTPLFKKAHNRLELTDAGIVFINGARNMLYLEEQAQQKLEACRNKNV